MTIRFPGGNELARAILVIALAFVFLGCAQRHAAPHTATVATEQPTIVREPGEDSAANPALGRAPGPSSEQIPVEALDPVWGDAEAPVTVVVFTDFQCPFCARAHVTLEQLKQSYGPRALRVVFKHNPLPFHQDAIPAAVAAQAVYELRGSVAFDAYAGRLFDGQRELTDANLLSWADEVGVGRNELIAKVRDGSLRDKVSRDMDLAKALGATGTPAFRINGAALSGAQPIDEFRKIIDAELAATEELARSGVAKDRIYSRRVAENHQRAEPSFADAAPSAEARPRKVPVGSSPVRGPADALVTIVEFTDYQCPYCKRAHATMAEVLRRYAGRVRLVRKHNPLPFHDRAVPAAVLAIEAHAQRGSAVFWQADELLFASASDLSDAVLLDIARQLRLDSRRLKAAWKQKSHAVIEQDQDLADDIGARGTPNFFINGRQLTGAQPIEKFAEVIDLALLEADEKVRGGTPRAGLYAALQQGAEGPTAPETKSLPAAGRGLPSRGAVGAPVVVQVFSDFECPFCRRLGPTLDELVAAFPGQVRIVWRNLPLPHHRNARLAAAAALEAHAQRGDKGFWQMHDLLFENQRSKGGLELPALERYAASLGLDRARFVKALEDGRHDAAISRDEQLAKSAGIKGTPGTVINGYFLSGAQSPARFKRVVRLSLADARAGRRAAAGK